MKTADFLQQLDAQETLYGQMLELGRNEQEILRDADPARNLLPVLERKRALLEHIAGIERDIAPLKASWKTAPGLDESSRTQINDRMRRIGHLLEELIDLETRSEKELTTRYPRRATPPPPRFCGASGLAMAAYQGGRRAPAPA